MGGAFLTCFHQLLLRERPSSFTNADEAIRVFASLVVDLQKLEESLSENSSSLQWCTDVVNLLRKMHFHLLCFVQKPNSAMLWEGVNCVEEYMKETLILLDFCNSLKSAISEMNRYRLVITVAAKKLHDEASLSTASSKNEIERLERESRKLYGIEKGKELKLLSQGMSRTKSKDLNVRVLSAVKGTMGVLCLLLSSAIFYPVSIEVDEGLYTNFPQLKLFSVSLKKLVCSFNGGLELDGIDRNCRRPVLVEKKMVQSIVFQMNDEASRGMGIDEEKYLKSIDSLKNKSVALKEGLEMFESVVFELFGEVVKGRNKLLATITAA